MSYDGVVSRAIVQELKKNLISGKIEKIYQPQPEQLLLLIHTSKGKRRLFISASGNHSASYLVDSTPENPASPPLFCMVLRKHLGAARITDIIQHESDRIIEILLETIDDLGFNVNRKLIIEVMGKHSNVLLIDMQTNKIIDSIKHVGIDVNRARQILPGKLYQYPPAQAKIPFFEISEEEVGQIVNNQLQPERSLLDGVQGLSPALASSIVEESIDDITACPLPNRIYDRLHSISHSIETLSFEPIVYIKNGIPVDFHIMRLEIYENESTYESISFESLSEAVEYFFVNRESSNTIKQKSNDLARVLKIQLDKLKLKTQRLNEDLYKAENSDKFRLYGELLTANLHLVKPGDKEVIVINYYDNKEFRIPLDPKYSASRNAQIYYKKYGKAKTAIKEKKLQLEDTASEIEYLESVAAFIERAKSIEEIELLRSELVDSGYLRRRKQAKANRRNSGNKKEKPKPYKYVLSSGNTVLVGRNNKENDWLTFKKASPSDIWLHTKDIPGSHAILEINNETPTNEDLFEAAAIAAFHSKACTSQNVPVDYTKVRYVKKPAGSKPGFVIFTHNRTLYVDPELPK